MVHSKRWTTTKADGEVDLRMEDEGPGSWQPRTVFQVLEDTVQRHGHRPALKFKKNAKVPTYLEQGEREAEGPQKRTRIESMDRYRDT